MQAAFAAHENAALRTSRKGHGMWNLAASDFHGQMARAFNWPIAQRRPWDMRRSLRVPSPRLHAFRGLGEDGDFVYFRVPRRRRSCPGAAKEPEWAAWTRRHRRDDSSSVAHRAKEEVSSRVAASLRRIGSADPSPRLGSWSRVAPRLPQKTLKSRQFPSRSIFTFFHAVRKTKRKFEKVNASLHR